MRFRIGPRRGYGALLRPAGDCVDGRAFVLAAAPVWATQRGGAKGDGSARRRRGVCGSRGSGKDPSATTGLTHHRRTTGARVGSRNHRISLGNREALKAQGDRNFIIQEKRRRGRPATGHDPMFSLRFPLALMERIDQNANVRGESRSEVMRRFLGDGRARKTEPVKRSRKPKVD
jgi:hypothetical protein